MEGINDAEGPRFTHAALAIEAAIAGRGIVVTTPMLASGAIKSGQLVEPFSVRVPLSGTYCVVSRPEASLRPIVTQFREWICKEADAVLTL
ncbi:LysR substrate-binding domain-containing protein [Paraburkholderia xenovorans]